jgi:hypothetical protein
VFVDGKPAVPEFAAKHSQNPRGGITGIGSTMGSKLKDDFEPYYGDRWRSWVAAATIGRSATIGLQLQEHRANGESIIA